MNKRIEAIWGNKLERDIWRRQGGKEGWGARNSRAGESNDERAENVIMRRSLKGHSQI